MFLGILDRVVRRYGWRIHASCLMGNHYHLVVETPTLTLSAGMRDLNGDYARGYNHRHGSSDHVFGSRFWAEPIENDEQLTTTLEYVVQNPVRAGLVRRACDWPWTICIALGLLRSGTKAWPRRVQPRQTRSLHWAGGPCRRPARLLRMRYFDRPVARSLSGLRRLRHARRGVESSGRDVDAKSSAAKPLLRLVDVSAEESERISTGVPELDRVLGGGLVPASLVLVGGEPGVGKSTLLLTALGAIARGGRRALLVTGEESAAQVKLRAARLGGIDQVEILAETELDAVCATLQRERPDVCVIDSIQTLYSADLGSAPGSVAQVREAAGRLLRVAKEFGVATILVGHVTKDGAVAGPRVLEHLVDCVLQFEATATTRIGSSARRRTASAPRTSSASSR